MAVNVCQDHVVTKNHNLSCQLSCLMQTMNATVLSNPRYKLRTDPSLCHHWSSHQYSPAMKVLSALQAMTLYKLFESKVVLNVRGTWYFLRGTWYFAQNRMLVVMDGSGEAQKPFFWYPPFCPCEAGFVSILQTLHSISSQKHFSAKVKKTKNV